MVIEKAMQYCRSILQNVSRSFALTIPMVEKNILAPILVGYLEARIMDNFEDEGRADSEQRREHIRKVISVIQNPGGPESGKNMKDVAHAAAGIVSNAHYLDLARNMDKVMAVHRTMDAHAQSTISFWYGQMAKGMQKYLTTHINTFRQLDDYCHYVAGTVAGMFTDLILKNAEHATERQVAILRKTQNSFGLLLQKVNIIRDFREDVMKNEKIFWPRQLFVAQNITPRQAIERKHERSAMTILEKMVGNAKQHIPNVRHYISAIPRDFPGFRNASIINIVMGIATLEKMKGNPDVFYSDSPVKIGRSTMRSILADPPACFEHMFS